MLSENGTLFTNIKFILEEKYEEVVKQLLIEKRVTNQAEDVFKESMEKDKPTVTEQLISKTYHHIYSKIKKELIDKHKAHKYRSIVNELSTLTPEKLINNEGVTFGGGRGSMTVLLLITLAIDCVISETIMVAHEVFTRYTSHGYVTQTELAGKLGMRLGNLIKVLKGKNIPTDWPDNTLYNGFTVEKAVSLLKANGDLFFTSFCL